MDRGYIKLDRGIRNWRWYQDPNTFRVWIHLLMGANFADSEFRELTVDRGSLITSYSTLANELKLTYQQARTAITHLKSTGEITVKQHPKFLEISIENYNLYQDNQQANQQANNRQITGKQQHHKKNKKNKKNNNIYSDFANVYLSDDEIGTLKADYPNDYLRLIDELGEYKAKSGKEYSSDYAAVISFANSQGVEKEKDYTIENEFEFLDDGSVRTHRVKVFKDGHKERS